MFNHVSPVFNPLIVSLFVGHPLLGATQRASRPDPRPQPCKAQAKDAQNAFMTIPINKYMHITNGNHQSNNCPHCQCYLLRSLVLP